jgi:hypothetical protein
MKSIRTVCRHIVEMTDLVIPLDSRFTGYSETIASVAV